MEQATNELNSESPMPDSKVAVLALSSMVLGVVSVCPSLGILDLIKNPQSAGDFQGGGIFIVFCMLGMTLFGLASVITGIVVLFNITINKTEKKILIIPAIIGIVLSLPGIVSLFLFFYHNWILKKAGYFYSTFNNARAKIFN